jgi:hypothetical protein
VPNWSILRNYKEIRNSTKINVTPGILKDRIRRPEGGGVKESLLKFLEGTRPISQNQPDTPLFQLGQDLVAMNVLLALRTGLGSLESQ